jgi:hypothetical protein
MPIFGLLCFYVRQSINRRNIAIYSIFLLPNFFIILIPSHWLELCDDSIACNSILVFAVMVLDKQAECQGKAGVITDKYSVYY